MNADRHVAAMAAVVALLFVVVNSAHLAAALTEGGAVTWLSSVGLLVAGVALVALTAAPRRPLS